MTLTTSVKNHIVSTYIHILQYILPCLCCEGHKRHDSLFLIPLSLPAIPDFTGPHLVVTAWIGCVV